MRAMRALLRPVLRPILKDRSRRIWIDLVALLVQRDLRVRYRGSFLGYMWSMMNPLLYMGILSFVFSHLMKFTIPHFPLFILCGILTWNLFHQSMIIGTNSIVANGALLRKVKVPSSLFPAASVCSVLVNFVLALIPYVIIGLVRGFSFSWAVLQLPVVMVALVIFTFGLVLATASMNVKFRDVSHTLDPLLQFLFYGTPVVYPITALPERYQAILWLNPLAHFVNAMRQVLFDGSFLDLGTVLTIYGLAGAALAFGAFVYSKMRDEFIFYV
jgi:ABC-type polysaccharide/polyol phosphate export permease